MNWLSKNSELYYEKTCDHCVDGIFEDHPELTDQTPEYCSLCQGTGKIAHKVENNRPTHYDYVSCYCTACLNYREQTSFKAQLLEALEVIAEGDKPADTIVHDEPQKFQEYLKKYREAQTLLDKYTFNGKIIEV